MTIAEQLEEIGRQKGFREGRKDVHDEGQKTEALRIANNMLSSGLDKQQIVQLTGLTAEELAHIEH